MPGLIGGSYSGTTPFGAPASPGLMGGGGIPFGAFATGGSTGKSSSAGTTTSKGTTGSKGTSTTTTSYSGPNWQDLWSTIRGQLPTVNPPPREAPIALADRTAMNAGEFGQAKDQIGRQSLSALRDLRANLAERGISGGAAARLESDITKSGYGNLAGVRTAQAKADTEAAQRVADMNAQLGVTQRGQDVSILGLNTNAALSALQGAIGIANNFGNRTTTNISDQTGTSENVGNSNQSGTQQSVNYAYPKPWEMQNTWKPAQVWKPNIGVPLNAPPPVVSPKLVGGGLGQWGSGAW